MDGDFVGVVAEEFSVFDDEVDGVTDEFLFTVAECDAECGGVAAADFEGGAGDEVGAEDDSVVGVVAGAGGGAPPGRDVFDCDVGSSGGEVFVKSDEFSLRSVIDKSGDDPEGGADEADDDGEEADFFDQGKGDFFFFFFGPAVFCSDAGGFGFFECGLFRGLRFGFGGFFGRGVFFFGDLLLFSFPGFFF